MYPDMHILDFVYLRFFSEHFEELQPLFTADPLLLRTLMYLVPQDDIPAVLNQISPYLATSWLAFRILEYGRRMLTWLEVGKARTN